MKGQDTAPLMIVLALTFVISVMLGAQDRFTVKSPTVTVPGTLNEAFAKTACHQCHAAGAKAHDVVFTSFAKR